MVVVVLVLVVFIPGVVRASTTLIVTHSTPSGAVPFTDNFNLPGAYDPGSGYVPADGTLVQVILSLSTSATAEVDIYNATVVSQPFTNATASVPVTLTGPSSLSVSDTTMAGPISGTAPVGVSSYPGILGTGGNSLNDPNLAFYAVTEPVSFSASSTAGTYSGSAAAICVL